MAETVAEIMQDVLQNIVVHASESEIEPVEANDFIRVLNRFINRLEGLGVHLGWTKVTNTGHYLTVPDSVLDGIVSNMSVKMYPQYVADATVVPILLVNEAKAGMTTILTAGLKLTGSAYPQTLPFGSGQENSENFVSDHFYPGRTPIEANLTMASNTTATTIATASTAVLVAGTWVTTGDYYKFTQTSVGKITYTGENSVRVQVEAFLTAEPASGSDKMITFHLYKNGFDLDVDRTLLAVDVSAGQKIRFTDQLWMSTNDYLEFYVSNDTDTLNILVSDADFRVREQ